METLKDEEKYRNIFKKCMKQINKAHENIVKYYVFYDSIEDIQNDSNAIIKSICKVSTMLNYINKSIEDISIPEAVYYIICEKDIVQTINYVNTLHDYSRSLSIDKVYGDCCNCKSTSNKQTFECLDIYLKHLF